MKMGRMSDLAIDIEESLEAGCDVSSIIDGLQDMYGFSRAEGLKLVVGVSYMLTSDQDQEIMGS
jgi:hypothetical protein